MALSRRTLLKAGAASGALLVARRDGVLGRPLLGLGTDSAAERASHLFPGTRLVHADLHNHSLFSDGAGDPAKAFASMRSFGLDVAALTDHSTLSWGLPQSVCQGHTGCQSVAGIDEASWARTQQLADAEQRDGTFVAVRGFEWSSPTLGHVNVWFSERWIDPLHTAGATAGEGAAQFIHDNIPLPLDPALAVLDTVVASSPTRGSAMRPFYEWLKLPPDTPGLGGGLDGIAGFNHPGREVGRFGYFAYDATMKDRIVSCEVFNRAEDYLFEGTDSGVQSPINQCLNAGWRVGLAGVSDEHGTVWGDRPQRGRTGIWVTELTRAGVRQAMLARRFFATVEPGLRLAATLNGVPMGGTVTLPGGKGDATFTVDVDRGSDWYGKRLSLQVLRPGSFLPVVAHAADVTVPEPGAAPLHLTVPLDLADGRWALVRLSDPAQAADTRADATFSGFGKAIAYASPFFLEPA